MYREVSAMENSSEEHNINQVSSESLKAIKKQQKQEIARLTEELRLIKSSVGDLQVQAKAMSSDKKFSVSKAQNLQGVINAITADPNSTRIKK